MQPYLLDARVRPSTGLGVKTGQDDTSVKWSRLVTTNKQAMLLAASLTHVVAANKRLLKQTCKAALWWVCLPLPAACQSIITHLRKRYHSFTHLHITYKRHPLYSTNIQQRSPFESLSLFPKAIWVVLTPLLSIHIACLYAGKWPNSPRV